MDAAAAAALAAADPDRALSLLADMAAATDPRLAALAARLAGRLVLDLARSGRAASGGPGKLTLDRADRADGDIDVSASLDSLAEARAEGRPAALGDLWVSRWRRPAVAVAVVVGPVGIDGRQAPGCRRGGRGRLRPPDPGRMGSDRLQRPSDGH